MHKLATLTLALLLSSCASYSGQGLVVGDSSYDEVIRVMGPPALEWTDAAGSRQLAYGVMSKPETDLTHICSESENPNP